MLLAAILCAAPDAGGASAQREIGKALFKEGKLDQAIARFEAAVALSPDDPVSWYNLAYASRKAQKFGRAADAYARYTALSPGDPDGYFGLAESLRGAGRGREALSAYAAYIEKEKRPTEQKWVDAAQVEIKALSASP